LQQAIIPPQHPVPNMSEERFKKIMNEDYLLRKEDIIWALDYIKQKVADEDPVLLSLHQPRLLRNFLHFAEVAMMLLHKRHSGEQEQDRFKLLLKEASYGLCDRSEA
jgi:hypothetical protein